MEQLLLTIFEKIKKNPKDNRSYEDLYYMCKEAMKTDTKLAVQYLTALSYFVVQYSHKKQKGLLV